MARNEERRGLAVSEDSGPDFGGLIADLTVAVGGLRDKISTASTPRIPWDACHPVWFTGQITLSGGAGTLNQAGLYGPETGLWWDVRSIAVWGFSAGTVTIYRNSTNGEQLGQTTVPGQFTWSSQLILTPQDSLVFGATGVTGTVTLAGQAIEVAGEWLPAYLM